MFFSIRLSLHCDLFVRASPVNSGAKLSEEVGYGPAEHDHYRYVTPRGIQSFGLKRWGLFPAAADSVLSAYPTTVFVMEIHHDESSEIEREVNNVQNTSNGKNPEGGKWGGPEVCRYLK